MCPETRCSICVQGIIDIKIIVIFTIHDRINVMIYKVIIVSFIPIGIFGIGIGTNTRQW